MPWTKSQHRLFEAAAHSEEVARRVGIPMRKEAEMASEGVKRSVGRGELSAQERGHAAALLRGKR